MILDLEHELKAHPADLNLLAYAKRYGFSDGTIFTTDHEAAVYQLRQEAASRLSSHGGYLCGRIESLTPYFYSSYEEMN